jgi:hypothetical protein
MYSRSFSALDWTISRDTNSLQCRSHDLRSVVDSEHDILDAGLSQCLYLMLNHGLVRKLDQRLRVCEGLYPVLDIAPLCGLRLEGAVRAPGDVRVAADGCRSLQRE